MPRQIKITVPEFCESLGNIDCKYLTPTVCKLFPDAEDTPLTNQFNTVPCQACLDATVREESKT